MKVKILLPLAVLVAMLSSPSALALNIGNECNGTKNCTELITEHSYIHLSGYIDEMKIYQNACGFRGQKLVVGSKGNGTIDRRQTAYVDTDAMYFNEWGVFDHRSAQDGSSDLRNALCAKNYEVGSVISETYSNLDYLIKDTTIYQDDNVSVYQIASEGRGTARIGSRVQDGPCGPAIMTYGGTYIGQFNIREELGVGNQLYLTCPKTLPHIFRMRPRPEDGAAYSPARPAEASYL